MLDEQFHNKYIVTGIQVVDLAENEIQHVHSIVVKLGEESTHFDVDGMLENLSSTGQQELANMLHLRYSSWTATDVEFENHRLNQILQILTRYLIQPPTIPIVARRIGIPPLGVSPTTASGSSTQASNNRSTARPAGRTTPRMQNQVIVEETQPVQKRQHSSTGAGSLGSGLTHVDNQGQKDPEEVPEFEKFTTTQKELWDTCTSSFLFGM